MPLLTFEALVALTGVAARSDGQDYVLPSELAPVLGCARETAAMTLSRLTARGDADTRIVRIDCYHERVYYRVTEQGKAFAAATLDKLHRLSQFVPQRPEDVPPSGVGSPAARG